MFCINSRYEKTKVINSRISKKSPQVWRRRQGVTSGVTFTTYERPSLADNSRIVRPDNSTDTFNLGRLIISIAAAFTHNTQSARYDSLWLAQTVEDTLSSRFADASLTPKNIADITHATLKRYDDIAAMQYAAKHHLITTVRRRGRPSIIDRNSPAH